MLVSPTNNHQKDDELRQSMEHLLFNSKMDEMIVSTTTKSPANHTIPTFTPWKLYHNPYFIHRPPHPPIHKHPRQRCFNYRPRPPTFCDLGFNMASTTKTELECARVEIIELAAELELERKMRKKMECLAKRMAKELAEERRIREEAERLCDELAARVSHQKAEIEEIEREMDEERRMIKVAEVIKEEGIQMKLEDAKIFYEEKLMRLEEQNDHQCSKAIKASEESGASRGERKRWVSEPENHHIKRGIKGFVEFPRGMRLAGSNRSNRNHKLECQKAQLRILLKQRSPIQLNSLVIS